jgi:SAM-dependent methyltransferase
MCDTSCIDFGVANLAADEIRGKSVIEVGALDVNGSLRGYVERHEPARYLGGDISAGPGVDEISDVGGLVERYGRASFDVVISTEMLEHVSEWRRAVSNMKRILKPGGILLVTTRSRGFPYHGWPYDFWRYEVEDMRRIFDDMTIDTVQSDPQNPGVFVKARMPASFFEASLEDLDLYSIVLGERRHRFSESDIPFGFRARWSVRQFVARVLPRRVKAWLRAHVLRTPAT